MRIEPTHKCFDDALDFLSDALHFAGELPEAYVVVHAICLAPDGHRYVHAWVERCGSEVWQGGIVDGRRLFYVEPREHFLRTKTIVEQIRYSVAEALAENVRHENFGPWKPEYRALCEASDLHTTWEK